MALFLFTKAILAGEAIDVFNNGNHKRDFTYVDDIIEGAVRTLDRVATPSGSFDSSKPDPATSNAPYRVFNIGGGNPVELMRYIETKEQCLDKIAQKNFLPMQAGDVPETSADVTAFAEYVGYEPSTQIETGIARFVEWYREYFKV